MFTTSPSITFVLPEGGDPDLGLRAGDEVPEAVEPTGEDRHLPPVRRQDLVALGKDGVGHVRRQEALEPSQPLQLADLLADPLLELDVQEPQLLRLGDQAVVVGLDPEQRPDAGQQLGLLEGTDHEVVGTGLERQRPLRGVDVAVEPGDHDDLLAAGPAALREAPGRRLHLPHERR